MRVPSSVMPLHRRSGSGDRAGGHNKRRSICSRSSLCLICDTGAEGSGGSERDEDTASSCTGTLNSEARANGVCLMALLNSSVEIDKRPYVLMVCASGSFSARLV